MIVKSLTLVFLFFAFWSPTGMASTQSAKQPQKGQKPGRIDPQELPRQKPPRPSEKKFPEEQKIILDDRIFYSA